MKQLKKTILTLALLIAATTQAWAHEKSETIATNNGDYVFTGEHFKVSAGSTDNDMIIVADFRKIIPDMLPKVTIETLDGQNIRKLDLKISSIVETSIDCLNLSSGSKSYDSEEKVLTITNVNATSLKLSLTEGDQWGIIHISSVTYYYEVAGTSFPITWDADAKTATIAKMPAGNVEVSPEYYPQATAGNGAVTAATGAQAQTDAPLVTVDNAKLTGATALKFCVTTTNSAPGYDDTGWTTTVPTAKTFNAAGGTAYVWYYPVGNDDTDPTKIYSDGDICATALEVTVAAAPTYDVVINTAGLSAEEAGKWSASPNTGVKKGDDVTVTYSGSRKVIGVKAEKTGPLYMKWDDSQKSLVPTEIPATAIKVENDIDCVEWPAGTYLVEGDVGINGYIELTGDVELIIKDGAKLTAKVIYGEDIYSLSVYGQTNMSGELNLACFGDDAINCLTALNIHSCKVNASSSADSYGGLNIIDEINVYGGSLHAENTSDSNGYGMAITTLNIYGGEVKAVGKGSDDIYSYGISAATSGNVNVYGGKLWAECAGNKAIDNDHVTLTKGEGFNGKIETCSDGTSWTTYSGTDTPDAKYVRVGY